MPARGVPSFHIPNALVLVAIAFLEFTKDKEYFIESNQAIKAGNPDVTVVNNAHLEELIAGLPKFVPLPNDII